MSSTINQEIYKSRNTMLELLKYQGYDVSEYEGLSLTEIDIRYRNAQLDMLVENKDHTKKVYVRYHLGENIKQLAKKDLNDIIEDLFQVDDPITQQPVLSGSDTLAIIVGGDPNNTPNDTMKQYLEYKYDNEHMFITIFNIRRLQFNVLHHKLNPEIRILTNTEVDEVVKRYNLTSVNQLPDFSRFDPLAMAVFMKPGEVSYQKSNSPTAMFNVRYVLCK